MVARADPAPRAEASRAEAAAVLLTTKGVWLCLKYEVAEVLRLGGGAIANTASVASLVGLAELPAYVASRHGIVAMSYGQAVAGIPACPPRWPGGCWASRSARAGWWRRCSHPCR